MGQVGNDGLFLTEVGRKRSLQQGDDADCMVYGQLTNRRRWYARKASTPGERNNHSRAGMAGNTGSAVCYRSSLVC